MWNLMLWPHPTCLQPLRPCIYADSWVESTQMNYQFMVSWAKKVLVTAILLFICIVAILPHIWVPFLYLYHLLLLGYNQSVLACMQIREWNPLNWTTNLWCPEPQMMIVTAILLFIWIVGILPYIWVPFLYSYRLILLGYNLWGLAYMQLLEWNPPKWTTNLWCPDPKRW